MFICLLSADIRYIDVIIEFEACIWGKRGILSRFVFSFWLLIDKVMD